MKNFIFSRDGQFSVYGGVLVAGDIEAYRIGVDMGTDTSGMSAMAVCQENGEYSGDYQALGNRIFVTLPNSMYSTPGYITMRLAIAKDDSVITAKEIRFKVVPPNNSEILAENESGTIDTILTSVTKAQATAEQLLSQIDNYALKADTYTKKEISDKIDYATNFGRTALDDVTTLKGNVYTKSEINSKISSVYKYRGTLSDINTLIENVEYMSAEVGNVWNITQSGVLPSSNSEKAIDIPINAGDNVALVEMLYTGSEGFTYVFDVLSGTVDLSNYYTKDEVHAAINEESIALDSIFAKKSDVYTKTEIDNRFANYVNLGRFDNALSAYSTTEDVASMIQSAIGTALGGEY